MSELSLPLNFEMSGTSQEEQKIFRSKKETYTIDEVREAAVAYFEGDALCADVWINKYALKDAKGNLYEKTPEDMHRRMAREIARIEKKYKNPMEEKEIYEVLKDFKYIIPQGGPMSGLGNDFQVMSLSNCFVIGNTSNADSYGAIMKTDEEQVQLMKRRGGVGHDLSNIRPKGTEVMNSALTSTGVTTFMERYSNSTREVAQDGRRGALMLSLSVHHPDIKEFITSKLDASKITGANISVRMDDDFMRAVELGGDVTLQFPVNSKAPVYEENVKAEEIWNLLVESSWTSAEPGILFWDTIINESVPDCYAEQGFATTSTNPCGEIPLCPYDSCRLLAINLYSHVTGPFTETATFNWKLFLKNVRISQRIMDDIVDLELEKIDGILEKIDADPEPLSLKRTERSLWENIRKKCVEGRRMGIGITGEGDMLAALGLQYGSEEAITFSEEVHKKLALNAYDSSVDLAKERGAFPLFDSEKEEGNPFLERLFKENPELKFKMDEYGRRNIALLTIAPTGTVSMMTRTTSGIEPAFRISYSRRRKVNPGEDLVPDFVDQSGDKWVESRIFHHAFEDYLQVKGIDSAVIREFNEEQLEEIISVSPYHQSTAADIDWIQKVKMQGAIQKWVDHSISVTVNLPEETPQKLIGDIFLEAWKSGCKGITVYRDGSRTGVLVSNQDKNSEREIADSRPPKRPKVIEASILRFMNNAEKWIAVVGLLNNRPYEIFTGKAEDSFEILSKVDRGWVIKNRLEDDTSRYDFQYEDKQGYKITIEGLSRTFNEEYWNYAKLISGVLRHGMPLKYAVNMVSRLNLSDASLNTWKNGVVRTLSKFIEDGTDPINKNCPECNTDSLIYQEGCLTCSNCGHTKCG